MSNSGQLASAVAASAIIGLIAWRGPVWLIALATIMPTLVFGQTGRARASAVAVGYFGAASLPVIGAYRSFWNSSRCDVAPLLIWLTSTFLLSAPWILCWAHPSRRLIALRVGVALLLGVVPPLGLIGWASPLVAAGVLFPGTAWIGLIGTAIAAAQLVPRDRRLPAAVVVAIGVVTTNVAFREQPVPENWQAVQTSFEFGRADSSLAGELNAVESLQTTASRSCARVLIFPEAVIRRWNAATEAFWETTAAQLAATGRVAVVGAGVAIPGTAEYRNAAILVGAGNGSTLTQRVPVPLAMWKPLGPADGVPLRLTGRGTIDIDTQRAAILICYEQLLTWPMLHSAIERPSVLVGMTNATWTKHASIPATQAACLRAWSRLFGLPLLIATNT